MYVSCKNVVQEQILDLRNGASKSGVKRGAVRPEVKTMSALSIYNYGIFLKCTYILWQLVMPPQAMGGEVYYVFTISRCLSQCHSPANTRRYHM